MILLVISISQFCAIVITTIMLDSTAHIIITTLHTDAIISGGTWKNGEKEN